MAEPPVGAQGRIFISYRRDDSAYPAGWLYDRLAERFGAEQIFKDVDSIELGEDFVQEIGEAVGQADVLLALIGERWLNAADEHGGRRLDDPDDFVRIEIEAALERKVRVIPILVEGAGMPREEQLPESMRPLARRQALELSPARFRSDTGKLLAVLERALAEARAAEAPPKPPEPLARRGGLPERRALLVAGGAAAIVLALVVGGVLLLGGEDDPEAAPAAQEAPTEETPTEEAPPDEEPPVAANGRIAFVDDGEISSIRPDGSSLRRLTSGFATVRRPDWSPDGTKVAFASDRGSEGDFDLWVLDTEDGSRKRLTSGPAEDGAPAWSPDGSEIAFGRQEPGEGTKDIWVVDASSGALRQLTDDPADDDAPDWSSTDRIVFESNRGDEDYELFTLSAEGLERDVTQVTSNTWADLSPDWSPDGSRIAYRVIRAGRSDIYTIDAEGEQKPRRLTGGTAIDHRPSWAPDGTLIAFDSESDGQTDILMIPAGGGEPQPLLAGPGNQDSPAWGIAP